MVTNPFKCPKFFGPTPKYALYHIHNKQLNPCFYQTYTISQAAITKQKFFWGRCSRIREVLFLTCQITQYFHFQNCAEFKRSLSELNNENYKAKTNDNDMQLKANSIRSPNNRKTGSCRIADNRSATSL